MHVNLEDTATGNVNGNNGKDEVSTTTPNVYDYEAENPPKKILTNPTEKYEKQKKKFSKNQEIIQKNLQNHNKKTSDRANSRGFS